MSGVTNNLLFLFVGGMCVFLIGINVAFLIELHRQLVGWFVAKLFAVTFMLAYTGLSVLVGDPATWRVCIAFAAVAVDLLAFTWMYGNVQALHKSGVTGLIPLARLDADSGGFALEPHEPSDG